MMVDKISVKLDMASGYALFLTSTNLTACSEDWHINQGNIFSRAIMNQLSLLLRLVLVQCK